MEALIIQTGTPPGPEGIALWGNHEQLYCPTLLYFLFFILSLYPKIRTNQIRYNHTFLNRFITYFAAKMNIIRNKRNFVVTVFSV